MPWFFMMSIALLLTLLFWRIFSNFYKLPCPAWLSWMVEIDNPFARAHKAQVIIDSLNLFEGVNILDIGCGPGRVLLPLAQKIEKLDGHVTGLDIQNGMIQKVSMSADILKLNNVDFVNGDIFQLSEQRLFDIALMVCMLGEIPQGQRLPYVQRVANHTASRGIISITETIFDPHFQTYKIVLELMRAIGFEEKKYIGNWFAYTVQFQKKF